MTRPALSNNVRGILLMIAATCCLTSMSSIVRTLIDTIHPAEIAFIRSAFGVLMLLPLLWRYGLGPLRTRNIHWMAMRGFFNAGAMMLYFIGLGLMPLAELSALNFTTPLFVAILAVPLFGERLGPRRIASLVIGFSGALVIIRPGIEVLHIGALVALGAAASWGIAVLTIKHVSRTDSPVTITIYGLSFLALFALIPSLFVWVWPTWEELAWLALIAALGTAGQLLFANSMKSADVTLVMPFDFTKLVWASLFGFVLFAEIPSVWTILGGTMIFASATYFTYRERHVGTPVVSDAAGRAPSAPA